MWWSGTGLDPEDQVGVFGVPFRTSIRYANMAISLIDDKGEIHTHGYIPIVVAMTGVFLEKNGKCEPKPAETRLSR